MTLRVFIAVTHLLGAGHLTRAAALGRAFAKAGHEVTLVSGGVASPLISTAGLDFVQLPPVKVAGADFRTLLDADGHEAGPAHMALRREALLAAYASARPDVVVTELFPFGRRGLASEFMALLEAARASSPRPLVLSSVRDILVAPAKAQKLQETHARIAAFYDAVLVHSDPRLVALEASWPLDEATRAPIHYTGYVDEGAPVAPGVSGRIGILVSGGSSPASLPLYRAAIGAASLLPRHPWRILIGAGVSDADFEMLRQAAPASAAVERARADFRKLLCETAVSVSQAGYNTVIDILRSGARAVFVPFEQGNETEQRRRAERLATAIGAAVLPEAELSPATLAKAIEDVLAAPDRPVLADVRLDGANASVAIVETLARVRSSASGGIRPVAAPPGPASIQTLNWSPLDEALRRAAETNQTLVVWWRDDDAIAHTPALDRLLSLANRHECPLGLAAIPALVEASLADRLRDEASATVLVHGLSHANHEPTDHKKAEFGGARSLDARGMEAGLALDRVTTLFGPKALPVFVPPWNRIAPDLPPRLPTLGYTGLSTFGDRECPALAGLVQVNTHIDPIAWHDGRGLVDPPELIAALARTILSRLSTGLVRGRPIGLLTHHLVQEESVWRFCEHLLDRLSASPNLRYPSPSALFATKDANAIEL